MAADIKAAAVDLAGRIRGYVHVGALIDFMESAEFAEKTAKMPETWVEGLRQEARERWADLVVPDAFDGGAL